MERRSFFKTGATLLVAAVMAPRMLLAEDYRATKPKLWTIKNDQKSKDPSMKGTEEAMKQLFGTTEATKGKISLKAPDIAENGAVVPISIKTDLPATQIAVFQSANPEATVAVFDVHKNSIPNYSIRIKMQKTGYVTIVAKADGKLYTTKKLVKVTIGGCGG
jgi:sulfur-oxidizing protein SoxY